MAKKKPPFVSKPRNKYLRGSALNPNAAIEARYYRRLRELIQHMTAQTQHDLREFFEMPEAKHYFAEDATISDQAKLVLASLKRKFDAIFNIAAPYTSTSMAKEENESSHRGLEQSLKKLSGGLELKTDVISGEIGDVLGATIAENVALIKSIPSEYFTQIEGAVMRSISTGRGLADLVPFLENQTGVTLRRARTIAGDQTRKAFSNLNFARMSQGGIREYEWLHSAGGQKPRKLHVSMSGNIYRIDKPPIIDEKTGQRGKPGDLINCRCRALPIVRFQGQS